MRDVKVGGCLYFGNFYAARHCRYTKEYLILEVTVHAKNLYGLNSIDDCVKNKSIKSNHIAFIYYCVCGTQIAFDFTGQNVCHS